MTPARKMRLCHQPGGLWVTIDVVHTERATMPLVDLQSRMRGGADDHDSSRSRRQIGRIRGDFPATHFSDLVSVGRWRVLVAIVGALSPHPKIPFPAGGFEHEV
jgi:hypothetical protein